MATILSFRYGLKYQPTEIVLLIWFKGSTKNCRSRMQSTFKGPTQLSSPIECQKQAKTRHFIEQAFFTSGVQNHARMECCQYILFYQDECIQTLQYWFKYSQVIVQFKLIHWTCMIGIEWAVLLRLQNCKTSFSESYIICPLTEKNGIQ